MRVSEAFPSNYVKAADLNGKAVTVVIERVTIEDIGKDRKMVVYFQGKEKGLVTNKTNANNIALLYGDDTDNWIAREVVLFSAWVDYQGKSVEAIRVRGPASDRRGTPQQNGAPQQRAAPPPRQAAPQGGSHAADLDDEIPFAAEFR